MYYGMIGLIVAVTFVILSTTVFFKIDTVRVTGSSIYTADEIIAVCGIKGGDNLIRTNMGKCADKIEAELIYIETAEITRSFPSTVEINITPCRETASVQFEEGFCLLSSSGKILEKGSEPYEDTIIIYGARPTEDDELWEETPSDVTSAVSSTADNSEEESEDINPIPEIGEHFICDKDNRTEILYRLIEAAEDSMDGKIDWFDMTDYLNVSCLYDGRITIEFGAVSEFDYKLKLASNIISSKIGPTTEGTLKILSSGASFIDKAGLEQNEITYQSNISPQEETETDSDSDNEGEETTTSAVIHFE